MTPRIDTFTLLILVGPLNLLIPLLAWIFLRHYERLTLGLWCTGCSLVTLGLMFSSLHGVAPGWLTREGAMLAQSAGVTSLVMALRLQLGMTAAFKSLAASALAFVLTYSLLATFGQVFLQQVLVLTYFAVLDAWIGGLAFRLSRHQHSKGAAIISLGMLIAFGGTGIRLYFILTGTTPPFDLQGSWNVVIGIFGILAAVTLCNLGYFAFAIERLNARLLAQARQYKFLTENMHDNVWILDVATLRFTYVSPTVFRMRGFTVDEIKASTIQELLLPQDRERISSLIQERIAEYRATDGSAALFYTDELEQPCKNGSTIWTEIVSQFVRNPESGTIELWGVTRDIGARKQYEMEITRLAFHDSLTNLPNRRSLFDRLERVIAESERSRKFVALLFIDLDNFKTVNDIYGHSAGDQLLIEAASRISACIREIDTVARVGGDEFVVLISGLEMDRQRAVEGTRRIAEKIRSRLLEPFAVETGSQHAARTLVEHQCSASIGVHLFVGRAEDVDRIVDKADTAMYAAKTGGRNAIAFSLADADGSTCS